MSLICNKQQDVTTEVVRGELSKAVLDNEGYIESGSAYFARAFAETLGLLSDLELHNPAGAELRLRSMAFLLEHALKQYESSVEFGVATGLDKDHEDRLREAGLSFEGIRRVLGNAQNRGFLSQDDERTETLAATFDRVGYSGVMKLYIERVRAIHDFVVGIGAHEQLGCNGVAWQELGWKLTTLFSQTLEVGKAIAILNTLTFRLSEAALAADAGCPSQISA